MSSVMSHEKERRKVLWQNEATVGGKGRISSSSFGLCQPPARPAQPIGRGKGMLMANEADRERERKKRMR
jgi:hypothetical protein